MVGSFWENEPVHLREDAMADKSVRLFAVAARSRCKPLLKEEARKTGFFERTD